jgi:hypothetical protein
MNIELEALHQLLQEMKELPDEWGSLQKLTEIEAAYWRLRHECTKVTRSPLVLEQVWQAFEATLREKSGLCARL